MGAWRIAAHAPRRLPIRSAGFARPGPLRDALVATGVATTVLAGIEIGLLLEQSYPDVWIGALFPVVGLIYLAAGLLAWARRPSSRLGLLIVIGGWTTMLAALSNIDTPTTLVVGAVTATLIHAVVAQMLLGFPTGRLHTAAERAVVVGGYVVCLVLQVPVYAFSPDSPLTIEVDHGLEQTGVYVQRAAGAVIVIGLCALLVRKLRRATPAQRRVLVPLVVYCMVALAY
ncbi:MAG: putative signal transduction histidine kinase, partial [Conexibacter sp.]|nr:putative signal transduction histidine kinase [Conexibacter sp.]